MEDDGSVSHVQQQNYSATFEFVRFMPDGSLYALCSYDDYPKQRTPTIYRFELVNSNWTITDRFVFNEQISFATRTTTEPYKPAFQLNSTHILVAHHSDSLIYIYEKAANGSFVWELKTSISAPGYSPSSLTWNGEDTIVMTSFTTLAVIVKLDNGNWTTFASQGFNDYIGLSTLCVDKDTFISSLNLLTQNNGAPGAVYIIKRLQGVWTLAGKITGSLNQRFFGNGIVATNSSLVFDGNIAMHSLPRCTFDPIDWDCPDRVKLDSCAVGQFDAKIVCKSNQPTCDSMVTTEIKNLVLNENSVEIAYALHRFGADPVSHSVTIDCSKDTTSPDQPSTVNSPLSVPRNNDGLTSSSARRIVGACTGFFLIVLAALLF